MRPLRPASPREHLAGTLALVERFAAQGGPAPGLEAVRAFLDRPEALPDEVPVEQNTLKYDAYLTRGPAGAAWGVAVGDRYEGAAMLGPVRALLAGLGGRWALDEALALREALRGASPALTVAVGYDQPGAPPRVKLYLQEDRWGEGVAQAGALGALLAGRAGGCALPGWVPEDRAVGVLTVELLSGGGTRYKTYLGGPSAGALAEGGPEELRGLAQTLESVCDRVPGWYYATLRLRPGQPPGVAMNKIYDHMALGFAGDAAALARAWDEVGALFARAGRLEALEALRGELAGLRGVRVVPTATALEASGRSVDLYCAAWQVGSEALRG